MWWVTSCLCTAGNRSRESLPSGAAGRGRRGALLQRSKALLVLLVSAVLYVHVASRAGHRVPAGAGTPPPALPLSLQRLAACQTHRDRRTGGEKTAPSGSGRGDRDNWTAFEANRVTCLRLLLPGCWWRASGGPQHLPPPLLGCLSDSQTAEWCSWHCQGALHAQVLY